MEIVYTIHRFYDKDGPLCEACRTVTTKDVEIISWFQENGQLKIGGHINGMVITDIVPVTI